MLSSSELAALQVFRVPRAEADKVIDVLHESFYDYPVMRFVLGSEGDYDARLRRMVGLFVAARTLLDDVIFGLAEGGELIAVATTSDPARPPHPDFAALRDAVWGELGSAAAQRYQQCVTAWDSMASTIPQLHVNMLGVRKVYRTLGLGGRLLTAVHALCELNPAWQGVSLTTEDPRNVAFYQHHGYAVIGNARIAPALEAWSFFRNQ
ncbi:MAG TPA: GNAT family N-acetyltransferase [Longimicrobiales bacterium]